MGRASICPSSGDETGVSPTVVAGVYGSRQRDAYASSARYAG
jgi:hypothetical protein